MAAGSYKSRSSAPQTQQNSNLNGNLRI